MSDRNAAICMDNEPNDIVSAHKMRYALTAIAQEVQKFRSHPSSANQSEIGENDELIRELQTFKSKLKLRKIEIKRLNQNLQTACVIAKTVLAAKENETATLNNHLNFAKHESANLLKNNEEGHETIHKLNVENQILNDKLQNISSFIDLGYTELQKMRNTPYEESTGPTLMKLKDIMVCCGQYYADYFNEHEKCMQLEQRNRFLTNKLSILENNLQIAASDLKNLQYLKIQKANARANKTLRTVDGQKIAVSSELNEQKNIAKISNENTDYVCKDKLRNVISPKMASLDLSTHLSLVKKLLDIQDTMLKDLKNLSLELNVI